MVRRLRCFKPVLILVLIAALLIATVLSLAGCGESDKSGKVESGKRIAGDGIGKNSGLKTEAAPAKEAGGAIPKNADGAASFVIIPANAPDSVLAGAAAEVRDGKQAISDRAGRKPIGDNSGGGGNAPGNGGNYSYVIVSASMLPVGARVSVLRADVSESCLRPGNVSAFSPVASGLVTMSGSVSLRFSDLRESSFVEIIYIDGNDSGHLDLGDHIWGSNPEDPAGVCFSPNLASVNRVNWDGVAAVIGGVSTYTGDGLDFLASAAGESQIPAGSYIIGESGYENL